MERIIAALSGIILALSTAPPAQTQVQQEEQVSTLGYACLNEGEWDQIHDGMRAGVVHDIIGYSGTWVQAPFEGWNGDWYMSKAYPRCRDSSEESIIGYVNREGGKNIYRVDYKIR